jgi:prophage regulatory protein
MRIIRRHELTGKVGYCLAHIYRLERAGLFPRRVQLGPRAVGWIEAEVEQWLRERADARDSEPSAIDLEAPREVLDGPRRAALPAASEPRRRDPGDPRGIKPVETEVAVHPVLAQRGQP